MSEAGDALEAIEAGLASGRSFDQPALERHLQDSILRLAKRYRQRGAPVKFAKVHNAGYGTTGGADLRGCVAGRAVICEVKRPGSGTPKGREQDPAAWETSAATEVQKKDLRDWQQAGAVAGVWDDKESFKAMIEGLLAEHGWTRGRDGFWSPAPL